VLRNETMTKLIKRALEKQGLLGGKEGKKPAKRTVRTPPKGYRAGYDPEFDYFNPPKMAKSMKEGGLGKKDKRDGLAQKGRTKGAMR